MKPTKGTKGRKPKPHSKGGKRAEVAKTARRVTPATRGEHSRAEVKRKTAAKASAEATEIARLGKLRKRPVQRALQDQPMKRIDADLTTPLALEQAAEEAVRATLRREAAIDTSHWPVFAIVGRPNVGKSTLFNRLTSSRRSIVGDEPGITRDRIYGELEWSGQHARVVDTGGILPDDPELIPSEIFAQAKVALDEADSIVMVVDGRTPLAAPDYDLARILLRGGKAAAAGGQQDRHRAHGGTNRGVSPAGHSRNTAYLCRAWQSASANCWTMCSLRSPFNGASRAESRFERGTRHRRGRRRVPAHRTHGEFQQHETSVAIIGQAQCGQEHVAQRAHRLFARHCFSHSRGRPVMRSTRSSNTTAPCSALSTPRGSGARGKLK